MEAALKRYGSGAEAEAALKRKGHAGGGAEAVAALAHGASDELRALLPRLPYLRTSTCVSVCTAI